VLERVTRRYPGNPEPSVDAVSLSVAPGSWWRSSARSGSGKTTTLRIAAGYEIPDAGRVVLTDESGATRDITHETPQRRGFGMVFQHYALFPHMTVEQNVAFGLEARGVRKAERLAQAREALAGVGLDGKAARPVQALSGGETAARGARARALVISPRVLLLDEPLSNLDPTLRQTMRDELARHAPALRGDGAVRDARSGGCVRRRRSYRDALAWATAASRDAGGALPRADDRATSAEFVGRAALLPAERMGDGVWVTVGSVALAAPARTGRMSRRVQTAADWWRAAAGVASRSWTTTSSPRGRVSSPAGGSRADILSIRCGSRAAWSWRSWGNGFGAPEGESVRMRLSGQPIATVRA
jgi:putative spermidine/putrescine transport system ATP-binding protein